MVVSPVSMSGALSPVITATPAVIINSTGFICQKDRTLNSINGNNSTNPCNVMAMVMRFTSITEPRSRLRQRGFVMWQSPGLLLPHMALNVDDMPFPFVGVALDPCFLDHPVHLLSIISICSGIQISLYMIYCFRTTIYSVTAFRPAVVVGYGRNLFGTLYFVGVLEEPGFVSIFGIFLYICLTTVLQSSILTPISWANSRLVTSMVSPSSR